MSEVGRWRSIYPTEVDEAYGVSVEEHVGEAHIAVRQDFRTALMNLFGQFGTEGAQSLTQAMRQGSLASVQDLRQVRNNRNGVERIIVRCPA